MRARSSPRPTCRSPPTWRTASPSRPSRSPRRSAWRRRPAWSAARSRTSPATRRGRSTSRRSRCSGSPPPSRRRGRCRSRFTPHRPLRALPARPADLGATIAQLQAYEAAGADVLFAPALPDLESVRAVCAALKKPLNFMAGFPASRSAWPRSRRRRQADQPGDLALPRGDEGGARRGDEVRSTAASATSTAVSPRPAATGCGGAARLAGLGSRPSPAAVVLAADKGLLDRCAVFAADVRRAACAPPRLHGRGSGSRCSASRSAPAAPRRRSGRGRLVGLGALVGLAGLLGSGFAIGASGWSFAWH